MTTSVLEAIQQDRLAFAVGAAMAIANDAAIVEGIDPAASLVTISQETTPKGRSWSIHYGPHDYINRRGGDLTIVVEEDGLTIQSVLHGQ